MPASNVKFLNGFDENNIFNVENQAKPGYNSTFHQAESGNDYESSLIEVSCKVLEINKVLYKPSTTPPSEVSIWGH